MHLTKGGDKILSVIDKKKTGINLRLMMDECGLTVKDVQQYLKLGSVQSVYHWLNGLSMPTVDNLYALSCLFQVPVDDMICGNRRRIYTGENFLRYIYCSWSNLFEKQTSWYGWLRYIVRILWVKSLIW